MMNESVFDRLRALVASGDSFAAAEGLKDVLSGVPVESKRSVSTVLNEVLIHLSRIVRARKARRSNRISYEDFEREIVSIDVAVLELIDEVERSGIGRLPVGETSVELRQTDVGSFERILGTTSQLKSLSWLYGGLTCAKSVCRIVGPEGLGTGFVVQDRILLTNHHVLRTHSQAERATAEFNFEEDADGRMREISSYSLDPSVFVTSENLDCSAVGISQGKSPIPLREWGRVRLAHQADVSVDDHVTIIQHPRGGVKQICLTDNKVVSLFENKIQYTTDTMPGSSGSPVFNDQWQVVGIHHAGGNLASNITGGRVFANQGILTSAILAQGEFAAILR